jgi:hypothetical protein
MREYGRKHPKFADYAERMAATWERVSSELEAGHLVFGSPPPTERYRVPDDC